MTRALIVASLLVMTASACVTAQVRTAAASTLECPEGQVKLEQKRERTWWVTGCGRGAVCEKPEVSDAEVVCAGGGGLTPEGMP